MNLRKALRAVCVAVGLCGIAGLLQPVLLRLGISCLGSQAPRNSISLGIIGGADGPTAIFIAGPGWTAYILPVLLTAVGILGFLYFCNNTKT